MLEDDKKDPLSKREAMIFPFRWKISLGRLPAERYKFFVEAILEYGQNGTLPKVEGVEAALWDEIQQRIDTDKVKYEEKVLSCSRNGKKGGRPRKEKELFPAETAAAPAQKEKSFKQWNEEEFTRSVDEVVKGNPEFAPYREKFISYWSEHSPNGKMRFQLEKTWETFRRLATWKNNTRTPPAAPELSPDEQIKQAQIR